MFTRLDRAVNAAFELKRALSTKAMTSQEVMQLIEALSVRAEKICPLMRNLPLKEREMLEDIHDRYFPDHRGIVCKFIGNLYPEQPWAKRGLLLNG